ncbi:hypothetical protein BGZ57DRAFT_576267 [Hyaloscypha finlandica]|nr:hypothetical protein BGZ57DRAFT_576267 [Hyaloscypha finlandica]
MTSPGRTHIPWQDQAGQITELISYIGYLEAKVSYLEQHHECCTPWAVPDPMVLVPDVPYLPPEMVVDFELSDLVEDQVNQPPTLQIAATSPTSAKPPQKSSPGNNPRWKRIIDQITAGWDDPRGWTLKRATCGLDSVDRNNRALTLILGLQNCIPSEWAQTPGSSLLLAEDRRPGMNTKDALILSARQYALDTKAPGTNSVFVSQIHNFRELVFASLCVVMEHQGLPINTINDLMRICMSSSGAANLYRLRRGALWVNRVIRGLIIRGWGHGATELFFLSGRPVSQYGLLWESCMHSFPYLSQGLEDIRCGLDKPLDQEGWIPFFIPVIIKGLVGDALTLGQITLALDYSDESLAKLNIDMT